MKKERADLYRKPSLFHYRIAQLVSWFVATFVFRRKVLRNEIRGVKGPFVVIANHQAALDFVNLIGMAARPMSFVISYSFYRTLPIKGFLDKLGVIPKQQFQSSVTDMKKMKTVVDMGQPARVVNVFLHPTPNSVMFWDATVLCGYLILNAVIGCYLQASS